jgi:chromosomal replication initiation ATPase DnaA
VTSRQLPLLIPHRSTYDAEGFIAAASNEAARTWLGRTEVWPDRRLALWGDAARGKTHLLRIWAARTGAEVVEGPVLSGFPEVTSAFGVAVDKADQADGPALLHLLNIARELNRPILLAGRLPPARWAGTPRDLDSRLRAITAVEVEAPDDALLRQLLLRWVADHQLVADAALHDRLLVRLPRDPAVVLAAVERLNEDALTSRRRTVTPAMVRAALAEVAAAVETPVVRVQ